MLPLNLVLLVLPLTLAAPLASPAIPWLKGVRPYKLDSDLPLPPPTIAEPVADPAPIAAAKPRQEKSTNDVFRVSEGNSVALFNGIPVDLGTGSALKITNLNDNPARLRRRGLRSKLGLDFLNNSELDEATVKAHLRDPSVGAMQMPTAGRRKSAAREMAGLEPPQLPETPQKVVTEKEVATTPAPIEEEKKEEPKGQAREIQSGWGSNSFMVYNGTPMKVTGPQGKPTAKALEVLNSEKPDARRQKRDIHDRLGLGMFEVPDCRGGRRKAPLPAPKPAPEPVADPEAALLVDGDIHIKSKVGKIKPNRAEEPEELSLADLSNGKQFVIYNGVPVEIDNEAVKNKKLKKPRPAFRTSPPFDDNNNKLAKRSAAPEPGRRFPGVNPFSANPLTTKCAPPANKPGASTKDATAGETNSETLVGTANESVFPFSQGSEFVRVNKGNNYTLCNGQPCGNSGSGLF